MKPSLLLDTNVLVRWLSETSRLSRDQSRVLQNAVAHGQPLAFSAISLLEIATLSGAGLHKLRVPAAVIVEAIRAHDGFQIIPLDIEVAAEMIAMGNFLRDPHDRAIVATARLHGLRLVTSDARIIDSKLVPIIE